MSSTYQSPHRDLLRKFIIFPIPKAAAQPQKTQPKCIYYQKTVQFQKIHKIHAHWGVMMVKHDPYGITPIAVRMRDVLSATGGKSSPG